MDTAQQQLFALLTELKTQLLELENQSSVLKKRLYDLERQMGAARNGSANSHEGFSHNHA